jgi:hypothetical protein
VDRRGEGLRIGLPGMFTGVNGVRSGRYLAEEPPGNQWIGGCTVDADHRLADPGEEFLHERGLADAWLAFDGDQPPAAAARRIPGITKKSKLWLAPHEYLMGGLSPCMCHITSLISLCQRHRMKPHKRATAQVSYRRVQIAARPHMSANAARGSPVAAAMAARCRSASASAAIRRQYSHGCPGTSAARIPSHASTANARM